MPIKRRTFFGLIFTSFSVAFFTLFKDPLQWFKKIKKRIPGRILGENVKLGHKLRFEKFPFPSKIENIPIIIIGGGVSGLSAARELKKSNFNQFLVLEMNTKIGGHSKSGSGPHKNISWGANQISFPHAHDDYANDVLNSFNFSPQKYLKTSQDVSHKLKNSWQKGFSSLAESSLFDKKQFKKFIQQVQLLKSARGNDHLWAFTCVTDLCSQDKLFRDLDHISIERYLTRHDFTSEALKLTIEYECKRTYGTDLKTTSAWMAFYHLVQRLDEKKLNLDRPVLSFPNGNQWIIDQLTSQLGDHILINQFVFNIEHLPDRSLAIDAFDPAKKTTNRYICLKALFAGPQYLAGEVYLDYRKKRPWFIKKFTYTPWLIARIKFAQDPSIIEKNLNWFNFSHTTRTTGVIFYPDNNHITLSIPFTDSSHRNAQIRLLAMTHEQAVELVEEQLMKISPELFQHVENIDIWRWGHGTLRPTPGFLSSKALEVARRQRLGVYFAHSDCNGVNNFYEAYYRGQQCSKQALKSLVEGRHL